MAIDISGSWEIYNEESVRRLQEEDPDILPTYTVDSNKDLAYNKKQVNSAITSAIIQGKSIDGIADDLQNRISTLNRNSAVKTARTAVTSAQNGGKLSSLYELRDMGVEVQKEWVATLDSRTRPSHAAIDGQRRELEEAFSNGLQYPGASGSAAERYNCRCTMVSYIPDVDTSDAVRWSRDLVTGERGYVPNISYLEWLEQEIQRISIGSGGKTNGVLKSLQKKLNSIRTTDASTTKATEFKPDELHPETLGGVQRTVESMTYKEADTGRTNPNYGTEWGYGENCEAVVMANEARRRGYNVIAKSRTGNIYMDSLASDTTVGWIDPETGLRPSLITLQNARFGTQASEYLSFIKSTVQENQRYSMEFTWRDLRCSHIVNVDLTDDGDIRVKDNQCGNSEKSEWVGDSEVLSYIKETYYELPILAPKLLRIDNLQFEETIANKVLEGAT